MQLVRTEPFRLVLDRPHGVARGRIVGESWNEMPVHVGKLVAEQLVVDLDGLECHGERQCDFRNFLDKLAPFISCQLEQLGRMALEHQHGPTRKELVVMEVGSRESKVGDLVIFGRPLPGTGFTGRLAFC